MINKWFIWMGGISFLLFPLLVSAHAFGQQFTLPLPLNFYIFGGTGAFLASFIVISFTKQLSFKQSITTFSLQPIVWSRLKTVFELGFLGIFLYALVMGIFGNQLATGNPMLYFFWIILLLCIPYLSTLIGGIWEMGNPLQVIVEAVCPKNPSTQVWKLGYLVALSGYVLLIIFELFFSSLGTNPRMLTFAVLGYLLFLIGGSFRYGTNVWLRHSDVFTVFFALISKLAPFQISKQGVTFSSPTHALVNEKNQSLSLLAFIIVALASTAYDGFRETLLMVHIVIDVLQTDWQLTSFGIFLLFPVLFGFLYVLGMLTMKWLVGDRNNVQYYMLRFTYSIVPIMLAYHFAHYFSLLFTSAGILIGADVIWYIQLFVIIAGHAYGAYVAHQIALQEFPQKKVALLSQIPMLIIMVAFTAVGLWILSQPFAP